MKIIAAISPKAQKRHRHNGYRTWDPSAGDKRSFVISVNQYKPDKPLEGPLAVNVKYYMKRPKSHYRTGKYKHLLKDNAPKHHAQKADIDNLIKFTLDAGNDIFWADDSQIIELNAKKLWVEESFPQARTEIEVFELN